MTLPLEKVPAHTWSHAEHQFLCVLWRWFERRLNDFAAIFNKAFDLNFKHRVVCVRLENHLRLYGPRAFPIYGSVYSVPFEDPHEIYDLERRQIKSLASELNIEIHQLKEEVHTPSGKAQIATAKSTRKEFQRLAKKAPRKNLAVTTQLSTPKAACVARSLVGGITIRTPPKMNDFEELINAEKPSLDSDMTIQDTSSNAKVGPALAWRVFNERSWTSWDEDQGFVSGANVLRARPFPPLPGRSELERHASTHFSRDGGQSSFVSVFSSFLQSLAKASDLYRPRLALIDLNHPTLISEPNKRLHAGELLRTLKARGECRFARYRGQCEFLIWANIPRAVIIHEFSLVDFIRMYEYDEDVAAVLDLDIFVARTPIKALADHLRKKRIIINVTTAAAMGRIAALLFGPGSYDLQHVTDLVARLVDGWSIKSTEPKHTEAVALAFAADFASRIHSTEDVAHAFRRGVKDGMRTMDNFERGRKQPRRHRKRSH